MIALLRAVGRAAGGAVVLALARAVMAVGLPIALLIRGVMLVLARIASPS